MEQSYRIYKIQRIYYKAFLTFLSNIDLLKNSEEYHRYITEGNQFILTEILEVISKYFQKFLEKLKLLTKHPAFHEKVFEIARIKYLKVVCMNYFAKEQKIIVNLANDTVLIPGFKGKIIEKIEKLEKNSLKLSKELTQVVEILEKRKEIQRKLEEKIKEMLK